MGRRRFIHDFFLALFLFCAGLWGWSYPFREHVDYTGSTGGQEWVVEVGGGAVFVGRNWGGWGAKDAPGWHYAHLGKAPSAGELDSAGFRLFGFQFFNSVAPPAGMGSFAKVPFWFINTLSVMALLVVWWRTRKPAVGSSGFEVV
jgi:hypothetical protein